MDTAPPTSERNTNESACECGGCIQCLDSEIRRLMERRQFRPARAKLKRLLLQLPPDGDKDDRCAVWGGIAQSYYLEDMLKQAFEATENALRFSDRDSGVWELRGIIAWTYGSKEGDETLKSAFREEARHAYERAITCCPPDPEYADRRTALKISHDRLLSCLGETRKNNTP